MCCRDGPRYEETPQQRATLIVLGREHERCKEAVDPVDSIPGARSDPLGHWMIGIVGDNKAELVVERLPRRQAVLACQFSDLRYPGVRPLVGRTAVAAVAFV